MSGFDKTNEIEEAVRRAIYKWVNATSPITQDVLVGDTVLNVVDTKRFMKGDNVVIQDTVEAEYQLTVKKIIDEHQIELSSGVLNDWTMAKNPVLAKTINNMMVQGIYLGDVNIPMYPAITVSAEDVSSEWITINSTKERYEVTINGFVEDSTQEEGHKFINRIKDTIVQGLKRNIHMIVGDYAATALTVDASRGDTEITVFDTSVFNPENRHIIIEDNHGRTVLSLEEIVDGTTLRMFYNSALCQDHLVSDDAIVIQPERYIYNSWPGNHSTGKMVKESLLQGCSIQWFAEEEEYQFYRNQDTSIK